MTTGSGTGTPVSAGTATLLTVTELRQHVETDLLDAALQRYLDANETEIIRRYGPHATATETLRGGSAWLLLSRDALSITAVTETVLETATTLAADDYELWHGGASLWREQDGTHTRWAWGDEVTVVYVPVDTSAQRTAVLVKLCVLDVQYSGLKSESIGGGDHGETTADYPTERERLLRSLAPRGGFVFA